MMMLYGNFPKISWFDRWSLLLLAVVLPLLTAFTLGVLLGWMLFS